ncbi:MAG: Ig-like domain repeat protein [Solirubrobacterales bacterium]|nr:Ig-like domain repeat protein [Solirubrobacterales bacterium]
MRRSAPRALLATLVLGLAFAGQARAADHVYVVDQSGDNSSTAHHCVYTSDAFDVLAANADCSIVDALRLAAADAPTDHDTIKFLLTPVTMSNSIPLRVPGNVTLQGCPDGTDPASAPCVEIVGPNASTNVLDVCPPGTPPLCPAGTAQHPTIDHVGVSKANVAVRWSGTGTLTITGGYFGLHFNAGTWTAPAANHVNAAIVQNAGAGPLTAGGASSGQPNIISNVGTGIVVRSPGATLQGNVISQATVGLDIGSTGAQVLGNVILGGTTSTTGLLLGGDDESGASITNNFFGVNLFGASAPFTGSALRIQGDGNTVQGNTIADQGAHAAAVTIEDGDRNVLTSNFVGTDSATDDLGPDGPGILLTPGATGEKDGANGNRIGGDATSEENVVSFAAGPAIALQGSAGTGDVFARNKGQSNTGPFLDIGAPGAGGEGPLNGGVNPPAISVAGQTRITGTAPAGGTVRLFRVGVTTGEVDGWAGNAVAAADGSWSFTPAAPLEAPGRIAASVTVASGTSELSPNPVVVDNVPPETTIAVGPGARTRDATPRFYFTATEADSTFACRTDGAAFAPCGSPRTLRRLRDGRHSFEVRARDPAGNVDPTPARRAFTVDTKGPRVALGTRRAGLRHGVVALRISCARSERARCSGKVSLRGVAGKRFKVPAGATRTLRLHVAAKTAARISARGSVRVRALLDARDAAGNRTLLRRTVTLTAST